MRPWVFLPLSCFLILGGTAAGPAADKPRLELADEKLPLEEILPLDRRVYVLALEGTWKQPPASGVAYYVNLLFPDGGSYSHRVLNEGLAREGEIGVPADPPRRGPGRDDHRRRLGRPLRILGRGAGGGQHAAGGRVATRPPHRPPAPADPTHPAAGDRRLPPPGRDAGPRAEGPARPAGRRGPAPAARERDASPVQGGQETSGRQGRR